MKIPPSADIGLYHKLFWSFACLHLVLWTIVPWATSPNAPLDVIEGYVWGHEWLIGTYKHPPMQAWLLEIMAGITGRAEWAHFLLSQIAIVSALWAIWQTGRSITTEANALLGALLIEGVIYFNFTTTEFNPNVLQTCFWALIGWSFHSAVKNNKITDWVLLGIFSACSLYSKYSALHLLTVLAVLLIAHPFSRRRLFGYGPYLSLGICATFFLPHILWLINNDFQPLAYAESRTSSAHSFLKNLSQTAHFIGSQALAAGAMLVMFLCLTKGKMAKAAKNSSTSFDTFFIYTIAFAPLAIIVGLSVITGMKLRGMWGASLWDFTGLWLAVNLRHSFGKQISKSFLIAWCCIFVLPLIIYAGDATISPALTGKGKRIHFSGNALAEQISAEWNGRYSKPLKYIIGDTWLAGNIAFYSPNKQINFRPHVLINGDYQVSPWIDKEDLKRSGSIIVWNANYCSAVDCANPIPSYIKGAFPTADIQQPLTFKWQTAYPVKPYMIGWAIIPPE